MVVMRLYGDHYYFQLYTTLNLLESELGSVFAIMENRH